MEKRGIQVKISLYLNFDVTFGLSEQPHKVIEDIPGFPFMSYVFRWPHTAPKREEYTKKSKGKFYASHVPKQSSIILMIFKSSLKTSMEIVKVC